MEIYLDAFLFGVQPNSERGKGAKHRVASCFSKQFFLIQKAAFDGLKVDKLMVNGYQMDNIWLTNGDSKIIIKEKGGTYYDYQ